MKNAAVQSLAVKRKYVAVRRKVHFLQVFAHVMTVETGPANLSQI